MTPERRIRDVEDTYGLKSQSEVGRLLADGGSAASSIFAKLGEISKDRIVSLLPSEAVIRRGDGYIQRVIQHVRGHLFTDDDLRNVLGLFSSRDDDLLNRLREARDRDKKQFREELCERMNTARDNRTFLNAICLYCIDKNINEVLQDIFKDKEYAELGYLEDHFIQTGQLAKSASGYAGLRINRQTADLIAKKIRLDTHPELQELFYKKTVNDQGAHEDAEQLSLRLKVQQFVEIFGRAFQLSGMNPQEFFDLTVQNDTQINPQFNPTTILVTPKTAIARLGNEQWPTPEQFAVLCQKFTELSNKDPSGRPRQPEQRWLERPYATRNTRHPYFNQPLGNSLKALYPVASAAREQLIAAGIAVVPTATAKRGG